MAKFINYTARDFNTIRESLRTYLQTQFPDTWSNLYSSGVGSAWLNLIAYLGDNLSYYTDRTLNEMFLKTAQERENVINICAVIGYKLSPPTSGSVTVTFTLTSALANAVRIVSGTTLVTTNDLTFELTEDVLIAAGQTTATGNFVHGRTYEENFTSDGTAGQEFTLNRSGVAVGSIIVTVNGTEWEEVDSIVYGDDDSEVYSVDYDADDNATIYFGDGDSGVIPVTDAAINITYRVGGGIAGNIAIGRIDTNVSGILVGISPEQTVSVAVYNSEHGSGGEERESIEHAKYWAPKWAQTNGRAVTKQDFEALAIAFSDADYGSPSHASAYLKQQIPELNTVKLKIWTIGEDGIPIGAGSSLIGVMQEYFDNNNAGAVRLICVDTEVEAGINIYITIEMSIEVESGFNEDTILNNVEDAIDELFEGTEVQPGQDFRLSLIYNVAQDVDGVESAVIDELKASLEYTETIATAYGSIKNYSHTVKNDPLEPGNILEGSIEISDGTQVINDDGEGNLIGDVDATGTNTVDYDTGELDFTFNTAPDNGDIISITYKAIIQYQRGETILTSDGSERIKTTVDYAPIVPGTFGISDGTQVINDDGEGNLIGDVDATGRNTIVYDSGAFDATFNSAPPVGSTISAIYKQYLDNPSEDIPVDDGYLTVKEAITIRSA